MATSKTTKRVIDIRRVPPFDLIRVEPRRSPEEPRDVVVKINGYKWNMQREEILPVPRNVVEVLKSASYKKFDHSNVTDGRPAEYTITRFPFTILERDISSDAFEALREIARERSITQADIDGALQVEQGDG